MTTQDVQGFSLKTFSAAVIGVGGLGCNIAVHLVGAGIRELLLFDGDRISSSNLNRQFLYNPSDVGENKADTAAKRLRAYNPQCEISSFPVRLTKNNIPERLQSCDMIFLAADNKAARELLSDFSYENNIPLVFGGIDGFYGKMYLYLPRHSPCPYCAGVLDGKKAEYNVSAAAGIIGSLQAATGIRYLISGDTSLSGRLHIYDGDSFSSLKIIPSENCQRCSFQGKEKHYD